MNRGYVGCQKQDGAIHLKAPVGVVDDAFAGGKANFIKILPAVGAHGVTVGFNLKHIKTF